MKQCLDGDRDAPSVAAGEGSAPISENWSPCSDLAINHTHAKNGTTYYSVQVTSSGHNTVVDKRFSEFEKLRDELQKNRVMVQTFPRKHLVRSNTEAVINERKTGLTTFLNTVVLKHLDQASVRNFLELTTTQPPTVSPRAPSNPNLPRELSVESIPTGRSFSRTFEAVPADEFRPLTPAELIKQSRSNSTSTAPDRNFSQTFEGELGTEATAEAHLASPRAPACEDLPTGFRPIELTHQQERLASIQNSDGRPTVNHDLPIGFRRATKYGIHE